MNRRNAIYILGILLLLLGLFTGRTIFFTLAYLLGIMYVVALIWSILAVRGIVIGRMTRTRRSQVGNVFTEVFRVKNTSVFPKLWVEVRDFSSLPFHKASHIVPPMGGRTSYEWKIESPCIVRGEFTLGPISLMSGDPFGLFLTPRRINATERILIYPSVVPISKFELPANMLMSGGEAQRLMTQNVTTNAVGVREYVAGDSINRIHWKSTARRNKLMVKEFEIDPMVDIWLLVDFSAQSLFESPMVRRYGNIGSIIAESATSRLPASTEEYAATISASIAAHFLEQERSLGFVAYTPHREYVPADKGSRQLTRILESLAVARSLSPHSLRDMLSLETHHLMRGTTLIIVTASVNSTWVLEAQAIKQRGIRPLCVLIDPLSFGSIDSIHDITQQLKVVHIPFITVNYGDNLSLALSQKSYYR